MERLGNRGFAITGILYTLFILFLLILLSVLGSVRSRKNMLEKSTELVEESYQGIKVDAAQVSLIREQKKALVKGKYVFELQFSDSSKVWCYAYLNKEEEIVAGKDDQGRRRITFVPNDCNSYVDEFTWDLAVSRERNMTLVEVFRFEGE